MRDTKDKQVFTRIPEEEKAELERLAKELDFPVSHIVRQGLRKEIAILREQVKETALQN